VKGGDAGEAVGFHARTGQALFGFYSLFGLLIIVFLKTCMARFSLRRGEQSGYKVDTEQTKVERK
jgi:hypothetical protein